MNRASQFRGSFMVCMGVTLLIVDPFIPILFKVALLPVTIFATSFLIVGTWYRFLGVEQRGIPGKWEAVIIGLGAGSDTMVVVLTALGYYFHIPITIPFL